MKIEKKLDVLDWMKIHYLDREFLNKTEEKELDNFVNELKEAINYTHCCETLKAVDTPTFKQWLKLKKIPKVDNLYYYKGTHYFSIEINNIYKEWCRLHL